MSEFSNDYKEAMIGAKEYISEDKRNEYIAKCKELIHSFSAVYLTSEMWYNNKFVSEKSDIFDRDLFLCHWSDFYPEIGQQPFDELFPNDKKLIELQNDVYKTYGLAERSWSKYLNWNQKNYLDQFEPEHETITVNDNTVKRVSNDEFFEKFKD